MSLDEFHLSFPPSRPLHLTTPLFGREKWEDAVPTFSSFTLLNTKGKRTHMTMIDHVSAMHLEPARLHVLWGCPKAEALRLDTNKTAKVQPL